MKHVCGVSGCYGRGKYYSYEAVWFCEEHALVQKENKCQVVLSQEEWGLICDAIEISIGNSDFNSVCNERFLYMEDIMKDLVKEIETQTGCQTKDD